MLINFSSSPRVSDVTNFVAKSCISEWYVKHTRPTQCTCAALAFQRVGLLLKCGLQNQPLLIQSHDRKLAVRVLGTIKFCRERHLLWAQAFIIIKMISILINQEAQKVYKPNCCVTNCWGALLAC